MSGKIRILLGAGALILTGCAIQPVTVRHVENFSVRNVLREPELVFDLVVYNPNPVGVTLTGVDTEVQLGDDPVATIHLDRHTRIPAKGEVRIPFRTVPDLSTLKTLLLAGGLPPEAVTHGKLTVRKFVFSKKFPFREKYRL
jgi:LEA14-like dessication related protein